MDEMLEIYNLEGKCIGCQSRKEFYQEIRKEFADSGKITRQVRVVRFLLMTLDGRIYIQKRSSRKSENAGLYDKTVGGHVKDGYTDNLAATTECWEELNIPMQILTEKEFERLRNSWDFGGFGIMQSLERVNGEISIRRSADGSFIEQPLIVTYYVGYYSGSLRFKDGESTGVETFALEELRDLIKKEPERVTDDLKFMVNQFENYLVPLEEYKRK